MREAVFVFSFGNSLFPLAPNKNKQDQQVSNTNDDTSKPQDYTAVEEGSKNEQEKTGERDDSSRVNRPDREQGPASDINNGTMEKRMAATDAADDRGQELIGDAGRADHDRGGSGVRDERHDVVPRLGEDAGHGDKPSAASAAKGATEPSGLDDHTITEDDGIGEGGFVKKLKDNIAAIRLLKQLE